MAKHDDYFYTMVLHYLLHILQINGYPFVLSPSHSDTGAIKIRPFTHQTVYVSGLEVAEKRFPDCWWFPTGKRWRFVSAGWELRVMTSEDISLLIAKNKRNCYWIVQFRKWPTLYLLIPRGLFFVDSRSTYRFQFVIKAFPVHKFNLADLHTKHNLLVLFCNTTQAEIKW